tara:strand:+ start:369 stop:749 length:381 start_codon:yes stop_codon:yes gene_type:complete
LKSSGIERLLDVRLNNTSQLASFAKTPDLAFFLNKLCDIDYIHEPKLAPTQEILDKFKKKKGTWEEYTENFMSLMKSREIEKEIDPALFDKKTVLLCSEHMPENCHRSLVVDYLSSKWGHIQVHHL